MRKSYYESRSDTALPGDLEIADVEAPLAVLDDRDRDTVKVRLVVRGLEVGVGMAADHEIHIAGTADEHLIQIRLVLETDVGEGDDEIALLLGLEVLGPLVDHLGVLESRNPVGDLLGDKDGDVRHKAYDSDAHTGFLDDGVRLDVLGQSHIGEVVVGADHRAFDVGEAAGQLIDTIVELVVAEGDTVVLHRVDEVDLDVASKHGKVGGSLIEVSGVEEKDIAFSVSLHDAVPVGGALDDSTLPLAISGALRLKMAVGVVDVKNGESALGSGVDVRKSREQTYS